MNPWGRFHLPAHGARSIIKLLSLDRRLFSMLQPVAAVGANKWMCVCENGIWLWINTYENTIFSGLFTSINPSYFDVNKKGVQGGFDPLPYPQKDP